MSTEQNSTAIDAKTLETVADISVYNSQGDQVRFGDIFADQRTIVIFIRVFTVRISECIRI
jgi:hypothetical protein